MINHLVHFRILSAFLPTRIKWSLDHNTTLCPVTIAYHPIVISVTASHLLSPSVTLKNLRMKPVLYGKTPMVAMRSE